MSVQFIDNNAFVQEIIDRGRAEANRRNTGDLGKQEFLNLLVMQLKYQDPLNPVDDKAFIAQMAQFSALEQMQNMNASNTAMKGFSMIGKYVTALITDEITGNTQRIDGHVESVIINGQRTHVVVGGREIPIDNIYNVSDGFNPLNSTLSTHTGLIGYLVKGAVFDISTGEIVGVNGEVISLKKGAYEDFAMLNGVNAVVAGINKNGSIIEDRAAIREYLDSVMNAEDSKNRHIEIFISDENGKRVPVGATLKSYEFDPAFGTIRAVLDDVAVPVLSVAAIQRAPALPAGGDNKDTGGNENENAGENKTENAGQNGNNAIGENAGGVNASSWNSDGDAVDAGENGGGDEGGTDGLVGGDENGQAGG